MFECAVCGLISKKSEKAAHNLIVRKVIYKHWDGLPEKSKVQKVSEGTEIVSEALVHSICTKAPVEVKEEPTTRDCPWYAKEKEEE